MAEASEKKTDYAKEAEREYVKTVLSTYEGRAVLWSLLADTKWDRSSHDKDDRTSSFNEGRRLQGLRLRDLIRTADKNALHLMETEAEERNVRYARYT